MNEYLLRREGNYWLVADINFKSAIIEEFAIAETPNEALDRFLDKEIARLKIECEKLEAIVTEGEQK